MHSTRFRSFSASNGLDDAFDHRIVERKDCLEDVLVGKTGVFILKAVQEQRDDAHVLFSRDAAARVPLQATRDRVQAIFEMPRNVERMGLYGGECLNTS